MKKLFLLLIAIAFILMGCVTTTDNQVSGNETSAYRPQYNMFEENDWISISDVQLFQDEAFLYLFISYDSENAGKYSIFNPPSGDAFKLMGDLTQGTGTILQSIEKASLNGIEGMTVLLYSGDFSNESSRIGFFINSEEIRYNQIPVKPENLTSSLNGNVSPVREQGSSTAVVDDKNITEEQNNRSELLSNSIPIDAEIPNIHGIVLGASIDEMINSMTGVDTLLSVWFPTYGYYELEERPETAYYGYEHTAFIAKDGVIIGMTAISPKYNFMGLMVGDNFETIKSIMGEPDSEEEGLAVMYWEYNMGSYFVVLEVLKDEDEIREISFNKEAKEARE